MVSAQTREAIKHMETHCLKCFSYMGISKIIKMDNGSRNISKKFQQLCSKCSIEHRTGIPYNPQGQATVEYAYVH